MAEAPAYDYESAKRGGGKRANEWFVSIGRNLRLLASCSNVPALKAGKRLSVAGPRTSSWLSRRQWKGPPTQNPRRGRRGLGGWVQDQL